MKELVLIINVLLVLFNTKTGLIIPGYEPFNFLLTDASIALSTGFIYILASSKSDGAFKIGLSPLFSITGLIRFALCVFMPQQLEGNGLILLVAGILVFELIYFAIPFVAKKSKSEYTMVSRTAYCLLWE